MIRNVLLLPLLWIGVQVPQAALAQDAVAGESFFKQNCAMCHSLKPGEKAITGPNLSGLRGRQSGTGQFAYSPALKGAKIKWTAQSLDAFLSAPTKRVPGTRMITAVTDPVKRRNLIAYLISR